MQEFPNFHCNFISFKKKLWQLKLQQLTTNCYSEKTSVLIFGRQDSRILMEKD